MSSEGLEVPAFRPEGSDAVARWAAARGLHYSDYPEQSWFRKWEPFDTVVAAAHYFNAVTRHLPPGSLTIAEPWTEEDATPPLGRALLAFASHPGLRWTASARAGEDFLTRVVFLERKPHPKVALGDEAWDANVVTHAASRDEALHAFPPALRRLLQGRSFRGHLEMRAGGCVVHIAGVRPDPAGYDELARAAQQIVGAALS